MKQIALMTVCLLLGIFLVITVNAIQDNGLHMRDGTMFLLIITSALFVTSCILMDKVEDTKKKHF